MAPCDARYYQEAKVMAVAEMALGLEDLPGMNEEELT
jgi:hypothetical protein